LHANEISFPYERMGSTCKTLFEKEAKCNSEMALTTQLLK